MQDKENPRGTKDASRFGRFSRTASFWILIFLIPLLIINTLTKGRLTETELVYTQFMEQLRNDNVGNVTIIEGKRIEGELRTPIMRDQRSVKEFWMTLPVQNSQKVLDEIEARNIEIRGMEARQNWWVLILNFLPNYISAGLAIIASQVVFRLGRDVSRARQMGSYELVERLGTGGMGEVWVARHRMLARPAAIKLVRPEALASQGKNTPFVGMELVGRVERTIVAGRTVYRRLPF